ncbi:hypothetical protein [Nostoc sp.]|uniref:hypothetical protein n=1 Tax=Nostoc sp. TaxID=1180 RepID=UPI002FF9A640
MNKYADITQDLQLLESTLQRVLQSPVYADMVRTGLYNTDLSLLDALHAVQQFTSTSNDVFVVPYDPRSHSSRINIRFSMHCPPKFYLFRYVAGRRPFGFYRRR